MWLEVWPEDGQVRFKWGNDAGPYPPVYSVAPQTLRQAADEVSARLAGLTEWAKTRDHDQLCARLKPVAEAGARLRWVIFDPRRISGVSVDLTNLKQWIEDERAAGDTVLTINADPDLHVPWGLVFEGDWNSIQSNAKEPVDFEGFWALRYTLSAVFSGSHLSSAKARRRRESFRLLSLINRNEYQYAAQDLGSEHPSFCSLIGLPVGAAFNVEVADKKIDEAANLDTLFHFFGHCEDGKLALDHDEMIDVIRFKMMMERLTDRNVGRSNGGCSLIFLNACETIVGDSDYSLRNAAARPGICGLVATEAKVPRDIALQFGHRFLQLLVEEGQSVGEVMQSLRREFWPISLLYGCYAHPTYRIERPNFTPTRG
jgi:hypothetical protein